MFVRFLNVLRDEAGEGDGGGGDAAPADAPEPQAKPKEPEEKLGKPKTTGDLKAQTALTLAEREKAKAERAKAATAAAKEHFAKERAAKAAEKAAQREAPDDDEPAQSAKDEPSDKAEKTAKAIEKAGGDAPDQKANETDKQYEARLVKALQDLRGAETQTKAQKARADAAEAKAAQLEKDRAAFEKRLARARSPEERLEFMADEMGCTLEELIRDINDGKTRPPGQRPRVDPAIQAELEAIKTENARLAKLAEEREAKEQEREAQKLFESQVDFAQGWLSKNAEEFPLLQAIPWAAKNIVNGARQNGGDMGEPARRLQQSILDDLVPLLDRDDAWKLFDGKLSKEAKEKLAKRFGTQAAAKPAVVTVPEHTRKPPSRVTTEAPVPAAVKGKTLEERKEERKAVGASAMKKFFAQNKAG